MQAAAHAFPGHWAVRPARQFGCASCEDTHSRTVHQGSNATFTVTAAGTAPLSYQWRFEGDGLPGATGSSYMRTNAQAAAVGNYSVLVTNLAGSLLSFNAALTVSLPQSLVLSLPQRLNDGQFQFTFTGTAGQAFAIQVSTNLTVWLPLSTNTLTNASQVCMVSAATNLTRRFHRGQTTPQAPAAGRVTPCAPPHLWSLVTDD
jgi:hypothetical protein